MNKDAKCFVIASITFLTLYIVSIIMQVSSPDYHKPFWNLLSWISILVFGVIGGLTVYANIPDTQNKKEAQQ
jgi:hypothetical protein